MKKLIVFFAIIVINQTGFSQKRMSVNDYKKLGRDSIISMATSEIRRTFDEHFEPASFDKAKVFAASDYIEVKFYFPIQYIPASGTYYYDISFRLPENVLSRSALSASDSGANYDQAIIFKHDKESRKAIRFIFESLNKSGTSEQLTPQQWPDDSEMVIKDRFTFYEVEVDNESTFGKYKVDKITGRIYDQSHKHYAKDNNDEKVKEIIK